MALPESFLAGVIEGFYGQPWSQGERFQLFDWMRDWGLNTYFYAPKDDLKHRTLWRELYSKEEAEELRTLIAASRARGLRFIYGIAPGLDIKYSEDWEITVLKVKLEQLHKLGCRDFAILFDDIPESLNWADIQRFGGPAKAQCHVVNTVAGLLMDIDRLLFCPTAYCGRMVSAGVGGENYLATVGKGLSAKIEILWTGPDIISREITVPHTKEIQSVLHRKPVIWDNLHANDYDGRRFFSGPYSGRPLDLREEVNGILSNPNCEFPLNFVPIRTLANFVAGDERSPRQQFISATHDWWRWFPLVRSVLTPNDLVLFCDCFYLPFDDGEGAERMFAQVQDALQKGGEVASVKKLRDFCGRLCELKDRRLFHALSRRAWELREELDLIERFLSGSRQSDFHLQGTFRGGFVARLQKLLRQKGDGTFES